MKNVDVEIYLSHLISFFDKNPNDLTELIGDVLKETFYEKVKEQCYKNFESGNEITLTQNQLIEIVVSLKKDMKNKENIIMGVFQKTKFGLIALN